MLTAATAQFTHRTADVAFNFDRVEALARQAATQGAQLLACPEMCLTGYWALRDWGRDRLEALAESVPDGPSTRRLQALARELDLIIGVGLIERGDDGELYNSYVVCDVDGAVHVHRKLHCFLNPHLASGDRYTVFDCSLGCRLGVLICYDNNIVENARMTALQGADILLAPHQTGGVRSRSPHAMGPIDLELWQRRDQDPAAIEAEFMGDKGRGWLTRWLPARAHDNGMFLLFSNGVGIDDDEVRTGNAMIIDCYGRIVAETWRACDDLVVAELDLELLAGCTGRRWLRGRRPALYGPLAEATGAELDPRTARFAE